MPWSATAAWRGFAVSTQQAFWHRRADSDGTTLSTFASAALANDDELVMVTGDGELGSAAQSIAISVAVTAS